jgi:hypothetical protein
MKAASKAWQLYGCGSAGYARASTKVVARLGLAALQGRLGCSLWSASMGWRRSRHFPGEILVLAFLKLATVTLVGVTYFLESVAVGLCSSFLPGLILEGNLRSLRLGD